MRCDIKQKERHDQREEIDWWWFHKIGTVPAVRLRLCDRFARASWFDPTLVLIASDLMTERCPLLPFQYCCGMLASALSMLVLSGSYAAHQSSPVVELQFHFHTHGSTSLQRSWITSNFSHKGKAGQLQDPACYLHDVLCCSYFTAEQLGSRCSSKSPLRHSER